jgi:hypothetical protein
MDKHDDSKANEPKASPTTGETHTPESLGLKPKSDSVPKNIDLQALVLPQDFGAMVGLEEEPAKPTLGRPPKQTFFSVNPDESARISVGVFKDELDGESYIVAPTMFDELAGEFAPKILVPCITRQGATYYWPIRLAGSDGRLDPWNESAIRIVNKHAGQWIRVVSHQDVGAYGVITATGHFDPPEWPASSEDLLKRALEGRVIDSIDHPVVQRLRGVL